MKRIREILLTQYIGAIVIAMLLTSAVTALVYLPVQTVIWYQKASQSRSIMEPGLGPFPWSSLLPEEVRFALYVLIAYLLVRWLYLKEESPAGGDEAEKSPEEGAEQS